MYERGRNRRTINTNSKHQMWSWGRIMWCAILISVACVSAFAGEFEIAYSDNHAICFFNNETGEEVNGLLIHLSNPVSPLGFVAMGGDMHLAHVSNTEILFEGQCVPWGTWQVDFPTRDLPIVAAQWLSNGEVVANIEVRLPTARMTILRVHSEELTCKFRAIGSFDPSGEPLTSFAWEWEDGVTAAGFLVTRPFEQPGRYRVRLTVTNSKGLSANVVRAFTVSVSPPEEVLEEVPEFPLVLVYRSNEGGVWNLYLSTIDGAHVVKLTDNQDPTFEYREAIWSPDGTKIAYVTNPSTWRVSQTWIYDVTNGTHSQIFDRGGRIAWLDNDTLLLARRDYEDGANLGSSSYLHSLDIDGTNYAPFYYEPGIEIHSIDTSPDGMRVVCKVQPTCNGYRSEILIMDNEGNNATRLTNTATGNGDIGNNRGCVFLNDDEILFVRGDEMGLRKLLLMDIDGSNVHSMSTSFPDSISFDYKPSVASDQQTIVAAARMQPGDLQDLYITDPTGQTLVNITNTPDVIENMPDLR